MANNVFDLAELRKLIDEQAAPPGPPEETPVEHEALTFPPVTLADDAELARAVPQVPLVADAVRLAGWTGTRPVTPPRACRPRPTPRPPPPSSGSTPPACASSGSSPSTPACSRSSADAPPAVRCRSG
ncbi:hypothetical protein ACFSTC_35570 [Nonomuraea ferruginea]